MGIRSHKKTTKTMTEQELRQEFKNHSDCYSDAFEVIQAMTEDAAIALAKAYADARESKEIAELKFNDLNAVDIEGAISVITGTARSMGITIEG